MRFDFSLALRVAARFQDREAKAQYLKAIDFTIGLVKRLSAAGQELPFGGPSFRDVLRRLIEMRESSQTGFNLGTLLENKGMISGKGSAILKRLERDESKVLPREQDLAAFVQPFGNKTDSAIPAQTALMLRLMAAATGEDPALINERLIKDAEFFDLAFEAIYPVLTKAKSEVDSAIGSAADGGYASRIKAPKSAFGKQGRNQISILAFKDLVGCRVVTPTVSNMAAVAAATQSKFDILDKKNYFLKNTGYNAINYNLNSAGIIVEFQLKTSVNEVEAALSHDLIYAPEKAIADLSSNEKVLVARVIDVSTQLSMKEWSEAFDIAMKLANRRR